MMKALLSILIVFAICLSANAQEEIYFQEEENIITDITASESEVISYNNVVNGSDYNRTLRWTMDIIDLAEGWTVALCDKEICSEETTVTISSGFVAFPDEECRMDVHAYPNNVEGHAIVKVIVTELNNDDLLLNQYYYFNALPSSTQQIGSTPITVYPNPVMNYFSINGKQELDAVEIYNINGELITSFERYEANSYDVSSLASGSYIVRMKTKKGQAINTVLINKL